MSREAWRTGEPTPGGSQSINSLTRSPTKRDLLLSLRSQCDYIYKQPGSLHYVRPLGCLQPFCNRSPCTVSLESLSSHPLSKTREREREAKTERGIESRPDHATFDDNERAPLGEIKGISNERFEATLDRDLGSISNSTSRFLSQRAILFFSLLIIRRNFPPGGTRRDQTKYEKSITRNASPAGGTLVVSKYTGAERKQEKRFTSQEKESRARRRSQVFPITPSVEIRVNVSFCQRHATHGFRK